MSRPERCRARPGVGGGNVATAIRERCLVAAMLVGVAIVALAPLGHAVSRLVGGLASLLP